MSGFVAVHLGAGIHNENLSKDYQRLSNLACQKASTVLNQGGSATEAVEAAVVVLENNSITNAGFGSNLTWDGTVECDASIMNGQTLHFGACGAVSNVKNPISLAKKICDKQSDGLLLGRLPPCILTGAGAKAWAEKSGLEIVDDKKMISRLALKKYTNYKNKLKKCCDHFKFKYSPLDTVGAICFDSHGRVAAAASSGGITLKHPGRVGQSASYAGGVWATMGKSNEPSVAVCTSGCGEHILRTQLAKSIADSLKDTCPTRALSKCLKENFCESPFLWDISEKFAGVIALKHDGHQGEFLWGHTTPSMCIGYMICGESQPKFVLSSLPPNVKSGKDAIVGGLPFTVVHKPIPEVKWEIVPLPVEKSKETH